MNFNNVKGYSVAQYRVQLTGKRVHTASGRLVAVYWHTV